MPAATLTHPNVSPEAAEALTVANLGLAHYLANRFAKRARDAGVDVEELTQVARISLWRAACKHAGGGQLKDYAAVVIKRALASFLRGHRPLWQLPESEGQQIEPSAPPDPAPGELSAYEATEILLARLTPKEQDIVRRSFGLGCERVESPQIAREYGITRQRVNQILLGALEKMRDVADRLGITAPE